MIELKSEGKSWNSLGQAKVGVKEEGQINKGEREEPVDGLSSAASDVNYSAAGLCLSAHGQDDGLYQVETKTSLSSGMTSLRSPQASHAELLLSSLNQRPSEKTCSYFQQKIPTWRVSTFIVALFPLVNVNASVMGDICHL